MYFITHAGTFKFEEGWSGQPKYCFKYTTLCLPCRSRWPYFSFDVKLITSPVRSSVQSSRIFVHSLAIYLVWRSGPEPRGFGTTEPEKLFPGLVSNRGLMADSTIVVGKTWGERIFDGHFSQKPGRPMPVHSDCRVGSPVMLAPSLMY